MLIAVEDLLNSSLDSVFVVEDLFKVINTSDDENFTLDFTNIKFISLSFA